MSFLWQLTITFLLGVISLNANAQQRDGISVSLGGLYTKVDSQFGSTVVGGTNEVGGFFDFESDLLMEESAAQAQIGVEWAFAERHQVSLNYFSLNRNGSKVFASEKTIADKQFIGLLNSKLDLSLWQLRYAYSFYQTEDMSLGLTAGLHMINFDVRFNGKVAIVDSGTTPESGNIDDSAGFGSTVPLPNIGFYYDYALTPDFLLRLDAQYFNIDLDFLDAGLLALEAGLEYYPWQQFSLYMGISSYDVSAVYVQNVGDKLDIDWNVELKYWGPTLMAKYTF